MMICGCTPSSTNGLARRKNSAARRVTVVVPSPISASCARAMSTRVFAAGCTMSSSCRIFAPSLEIVACTGGEGVLTNLTSNKSETDWSHPRPIVDELVHATRPKSGANSFCDGLARVDVADELRLALARVCGKASSSRGSRRSMLTQPAGHTPVPSRSNMIPGCICCPGFIIFGS